MQERRYFPHGGARSSPSRPGTRPLDDRRPVRRGTACPPTQDKTMDLIVTLIVGLIVGAIAK
ncbi:hypothetical protein, partial [Accumulibacter sp.]|uniref:GlsB/YeaQ/YmgE family stress response membrane protein n=1 Tax=Accumulibacter sp. TaxID=2053492 RepID=UPI002D1FBF84